MRNTAQNIANKQKDKEPKPPIKPKFRSIHRVAKNDASIPWVIYQGVDELTEDNVLDEKNFVVELAPIKYKDRLRYEREHGESIDEIVTKIVWVLDKMYSVLSNDLDNEKRQEIAKQITRDDMGRYETPMGFLWGSMDLNISSLCTYILACKGRIVGKDVNGYILEPIVPNDILEVLEGNPFMELNDEFIPVVIEILDVAGLYNIEETLNLKESVDKEEAEKKGPQRKKKGVQPIAKS